MNGVSSIYECTVMHHRLAPKEHRFEYRLFYLWLDLDELDEQSKRLRLFSRNRWNIFAFHDSDHLEKGHPDTKSNVLAILREHGVETAQITQVCLLTLPRVLGYIFNPVCFYYCFDSAGQPVCALAQVTNTFHEQKPFVLTQQERGAGFRLVVPKHFYVSPFSDLEVCFDFKLRLPTEHLEIHVDDLAGSQPLLLTRLSGRRRDLTDAALLLCAVKYPLLTLRVIFLIHWHALRLWLKRLTVHRKAAHPELQRGVYRPHQSIASPPP